MKIIGQEKVLFAGIRIFVTDSAQGYGTVTGLWPGQNNGLIGGEPLTFEHRTPLSDPILDVAFETSNEIVFSLVECVEP